MRRRLAWTGVWLAIGALLWLPLTSVALCFALGTLDRISPFVLPMAAYHYWRDFGGRPAVAFWLPLCAGGAGLLALAPAWCALFWPGSRRLRAARAGQTAPAPRRALSDLHGGADWMSMADARRLFPGPHPAYGGVVVGEAYRVDQDKVAPSDSTPMTGARGAGAAPCRC